MITILFGAGQIAEKELNAGNIPFAIVDNNSELHGTTFLGIKIISPNELVSYQFDKIIICSSSISDIIEQIVELGINKDCIVVSNFIGPQARTFILENYRFKGFVSSGLPSTTKSLKGGGIYSVEELDDFVKVEKLYEGNTHGMIFHEGKLVFTCQGKGIVIFNVESKEIENTIPVPAGYRPHGVRIIDGNYFVACSSADRVLELNFKGEILNEYLLSSKKESSQTAQHHTNDLYVTEDSIYVSMFSISGNWKKGIFDGGVIEINRNTGKQCNVITNLKMPHSVSMYDGALYVLDSYRGRVCGYDGVSIGALSGFVRGIEFHDELILVGESKNRNISKLEPRDMFSSIDTRISILDPVTKASRSISLPRGISEIHSIVVVN